MFLISLQNYPKKIHETPLLICSICSIVTGFLIGQSAWWLKLLPKSNHLFLLPPEPLCKISIQPVHNILSKIKQKVKQTNTTEKHNLPGKGNKYLNISAWLISSIVTNGIVQINFSLLYKNIVIKWISSSDLLWLHNSQHSLFKGRPIEMANFNFNWQTQSWSSSSVTTILYIVSLEAKRI